MQALYEDNTTSNSAGGRIYACPRVSVPPRATRHVGAMKRKDRCYTAASASENRAKTAQKTTPKDGNDTLLS